MSIVAPLLTPLAKWTAGIGVIIWSIRHWMQGPKFQSKKRIDGKTVVITGANTGIGKICAIDMAKRGGKVVILCRDPNRGAAALADIKKESGSNDVHFYQMDLSDLSSVRACAKKMINELDRIDILLNNAGVMACPFEKTVDGYERQFQTNHLGHFLLVHLLLPLLREGAPGARIVNVSSIGHTRGTINFDDLFFEKTKYTPMSAYRQSKIANILFTKELAVRYGAEGIHSYSLHPGAIATDLPRNIKESFGYFGWFVIILSKIFLKTPEAGAQTSLYCCLEDSIKDQNGLYYSDCRETAATAEASNMENAKRLWTVSEQLTGI